MSTRPNAVAFFASSFDVLILAGPRLARWPSVGARELSKRIAEFGLKVGMYGGDGIRVKGVLPMEPTGGVALLEDAQKRVHRVTARSIVRMVQEAELPDPFPGWHSPALLALSTAERLLVDFESVYWGQAKLSGRGVALLGSGNRLLKFGARLLEGGIQEVVCVDSPGLAAPGALGAKKRYHAWEVEKRRFEMLGGKWIEGDVVAVQPSGAQSWELKVRDSNGVRILEVFQVVTGGPFETPWDFREYPEGSLLYEFPQSSLTTAEEHMEGWHSEEERAHLLAVRVIRALSDATHGREPLLREDLERLAKRAKLRLRRQKRHLFEPYEPAYEGKWLSAQDSKRLREFPGVPVARHQEVRLASIECFEPIECRLCEASCPEGAISLKEFWYGEATRILDEAKCTACGVCLQVCPSDSIVMLREKEARGQGEVTFHSRDPEVALSGARRAAFKEGELLASFNRRGEPLGSARVQRIERIGENADLVTVEVPGHLIWDARAFRRTLSDRDKHNDLPLFDRGASASPAAERRPERVEVQINGARRLVELDANVAEALFVSGARRAGDGANCPDGSCGLCTIFVDGQKALACQTPTRKGMTLEFPPREAFEAGDCRPEDALCPCLGISENEVRERLRKGSLKSAEAVALATRVGQGRCHGLYCMGAFRRVLQEEGVAGTERWVDWRFPWMDWKRQGG